MTNFDFLKNEPQFATFADAAIAAEKIYSIDSEACVINCRRSMEFAVKWLYSVDEGLVMPWDNKLAVLIHNPSFQDFVDALSRKGIRHIEGGIIFDMVRTDTLRQHATASPWDIPYSQVPLLMKGEKRIRQDFQYIHRKP